MGTLAFLAAIGALFAAGFVAVEVLGRRLDRENRRVLRQMEDHLASTRDHISRGEAIRVTAERGVQRVDVTARTETEAIRVLVAAVNAFDDQEAGE